jgi:uncharacterized membrane protein YheB (UPF0754 family)
MPTTTTSYVDIYDLFMELQRDYRLIGLYNDDVANSTTNLNTMLQGWLILGIGDFLNICDQDLEDRDDSTEIFNFLMTTRNKNMLAKLIKKYWLQQEIHDIAQMRGKLQDAYHTYSESQNTKSKSDLLTKVEEELSQDLVEYGYSDRTMWEYWIANGFSTLQP